MADRKQIIAAAISEMTFGELMELAREFQDVIDIYWRTHSDEHYPASSLAASLYAWAEAQEKGTPNG